MLPGGLCAIPLTKGAVTVIDQADLPFVLGRSWYLKSERSRYAATKQTCAPSILLHRHLLGVSGRALVDHINGDSLDNRRSNLRLSTTSLNAANKTMPRHSSMFKGVCFDARPKRQSPWKAQIRVSGRLRLLGFFRTQEDAALAYDLAAIRFFGERAKTNIIENGPQFGELFGETA